MLGVVRRDRQAHLRRQLGACHSTPRGVHCRGPQCVQTIRCNHRHCSDEAAVQVNAATQVQGDSRIIVPTFMPVSKRPLGLSMRNEGGLNGYSGGSRMRPWYKPPCGVQGT